MRIDVHSLRTEESPEFTGLTYDRYKHLVKHGENNRQAFYSIGARIDNIPAGLALCELISPETVELKSLFVLPQYRRKGVAGALLNLAEREAKQRGCRTFAALYQDQGPCKDGIAHLLKASGYSEPAFSGLVCKSRNRGKILDAPFLKKSLLPPSCEVFLWKDLAPAEKEFIREKQKHTPWYPEILSPFSNETEIEYLNSLGLRYRGEIAGWVITHRISRKPYATQHPLSGKTCSSMDLRPPPH